MNAGLAILSVSGYNRSMTKPTVQTVHLTEAVQYEIHGPDAAVLHVYVEDGSLVWRDITLQEMRENTDDDAE